MIKEHGNDIIIHKKFYKKNNLILWLRIVNLVLRIKKVFIHAKKFNQHCVQSQKESNSFETLIDYLSNQWELVEVLCFSDLNSVELH